MAKYSENTLTSWTKPLAIVNKLNLRHRRKWLEKQLVRTKD